MVLKGGVLGLARRVKGRGTDRRRRHSASPEATPTLGTLGRSA
jgi:hypothetical protein